MIRKLLNPNGTIGDLSIKEMKEFLGIGKKKALPENKNYTDD